ncbi:hypothetical protein D9V86_03310, partial [Bacteroidetes/Chlorobi group bacterium ChocPot_Mid]
YEKHQKPIPSINAFTLNGFVEYSYDFIFEDRKRFSISDAYRMALLDEACVNANLKFYSSNKRRLSPVILERLADVIFGLKEDGMTVEDLKKDIKNEDDTYFYDIARLNDVVELYGKYEELLEGKYLDFPEIIKKITAYIASSDDDLFFNQILSGKKFVLINGFTDFKIPEINFISLFAQSKIPFAINIDYSTNNGPLFGNLNDYISLFNSKGLKISSPEDIEEKKYLANKSNCEVFSESKDYPRERYLRTMLFNNDSDLRNKAFSKIISIIEAENRFNEVKYIAKLTHYLIVSEGYLPKDICVCMRKPETYSNLFRELFSSFKVPANISDRFPLSSSPLIISIFSILDIIIYDYRIEDIHKTLLSSYLSFGDGNFDAKNLITLAEKLRILGGSERGGADFWEKNIESHLDFNKKRLSNMLRNSSEQFDDIERLTQENNSIEKALNDFKMLRTIIPAKKKNYSPKEFKDLILNSIIEHLQIRRNIFESFEDFLKMKNDMSIADKAIYEEAIEKDARALESFLRLLNEITSIISERNPGKRFSLSELTNKLKVSVSAEKYQIHEKQNMGVNITSIEQIRGIPYKVLILCGAIDGEFPLSYRPETFLGKELKNTIERHIQSERIQFYQFLTNDKESLDKSEKLIYIFYPERKDSEELVRSSFVDALLKITSLQNDLKVYNIAKIQKYLSDNVSGKSEEIEIQSKQLPWLNMIQSGNELFYEAGSVLKVSDKIELKNDFSEIHTDTLKYIEYLITNALQNRGVIDLNLLSDDARNRIERYREKPISITELETYKKCPFKLFVSKILRIQEPCIFELELSPMDIGNILHSIVYKFYISNQTILYNNKSFEYKKDSINDKLPVIIPVVLERKNYDIYLKQLVEIAKEEFELFKYEHPFFYLETERIIGSSTKPGVLERWLISEIQRFEDSDLFKPVLFEFSFGSYYSVKYKSFTEFIEIDGLKIQGKVDRVELMKNNENYGFMIADYKNKMRKVAKNSEVNNYESFQMPLYILAIQKILEDYYGIKAEPMGGIYYGFEPEVIKGKAISQKYLITERSNPRVPKELYRANSQILNEKVTLQEILQNSLREAKQIVENIINGNFPVEPKNDDTCKYCGYYPICRIKEKKNILGEFIAEDDSEE